MTSTGFRWALFATGLAPVFQHLGPLLRQLGVLAAVGRKELNRVNQPLNSAYAWVRHVAAVDAGDRVVVDARGVGELSPDARTAQAAEV